MTHYSLPDDNNNSQINQDALERFIESPYWHLSTKKNWCRRFPDGIVVTIYKDKYALLAYKFSISKPWEEKVHHIGLFKSVIEAKIAAFKWLNKLPMGGTNA